MELENGDFGEKSLSLFGDPFTPLELPGTDANNLSDARPREHHVRCPPNNLKKARTSAHTATHQDSFLSDLEFPGNKRKFLIPKTQQKAPPMRDGSVVEARTRVESPVQSSFPASPFTPHANDSLDRSYLADSETHQYHLRDRIVDFPSAIGIDKDDSGNYDPKKALRVERKRHRDQLRRANLESDDAGNNHERVSKTFKSKYTALNHGGQLVFRIALTSDKLKAAATKIPNNWPEESYNFLADEVVEDARGDFGLRNRLDEEYEEYTPLSDPLGIHETLENHPDARGCVGCRLLQSRCPMLDGCQWPCTICLEDGDACILIAPPNRKASCEDCKFHKVTCSFRDDKNQGLQCKQCIAGGRKLCVAGPAPGYQNVRISLDKDPSEQSLKPPREFVKCTACRMHRIPCSLKSTEDLPPCDNCSSIDAPCTFEALPKVRKAKRSKLEKGKQPIYADEVESSSEPLTEDDESSSDDPTEIDEPIASLNSQIAVYARHPEPRRSGFGENSTGGPLAPRPVKIHTALCHPITFNCDTTDRQYSDPFRRCDWCAKRGIFEAYGHGFIDCVVIERRAGLMYEERKGHIDKGRQPSRICTIHTMERLRIIDCAHNEMDRLKEEQIFTMNKYFSEPDTKQMIYCSICPSPPSYQCAVPHMYDSLGRELDPDAPQAKGCGLFLCANCYSILQGFGGDIQQMLKELQADPEKYPQGVKADAELLLRDGLLERNCLAEIKKPKKKR